VQDADAEAWFSGHYGINASEAFKQWLEDPCLLGEQLKISE
jgi:hypothetical protein